MFGITVFFIVMLFLIGFLHILFFSPKKIVFCSRILKEKYTNKVFFLRWFRFLWEPWHCGQPMISFKACYAVSTPIDCTHKKKGKIDIFNDYYACPCCGHDTFFYSGD